jgi:hypothetical protein
VGGLVQPGRYRHFKGAVYVVVGVARHSETEEPFVVYHRDGSSELAGTEPASPELWVRPLAMWTERVERDGYDGPRFAPVEFSPGS